MVTDGEPVRSLVTLPLPAVTGLPIAIAALVDALRTGLSDLDAICASDVASASDPR